MDKTLQDFIEELIKLQDDEDTIKLRSYSGRGMMGKECLGVTVDSYGDLLIDLAAAIAQENGDGYLNDDDRNSLLAELKAHDTDNMGRGRTIVYFPGVPFATVDRDEGDYYSPGY